MGGPRGASREQLGGRRPPAGRRGFKFTFDCPSPDQYWEIHIETPKFSPFPDYLDSMIGSCENRSFTIAYPGIITRDDPRLRSEAEVFANYVSKPATAGGGSARA